MNAVIQSQYGVSDVDPNAALNENQASEFLGVSVRTLQAWRVRGGGPAYTKMGRLVRYQRRSLMSFQETNTRASTTVANVAPAGAR